jgi:hypothetical protein
MEDTGVPSHEATDFSLTTRVVYRLAQRPLRRECCGCVGMTLWYPFTAIQRVERLPLAVPEVSQLSQIFALRFESFGSGAILQHIFLYILYIFIHFIYFYIFNIFLYVLSALNCHFSALTVDNRL